MCFLLRIGSVGSPIYLLEFSLGYFATDRQQKKAPGDHMFIEFVRARGGLRVPPAFVSV